MGLDSRLPLQSKPFDIPVAFLATHLRCAICGLFYKDPVAMPCCSKRFCRNCIHKFAEDGFVTLNSDSHSFLMCFFTPSRRMHSRFFFFVVLKKKNLAVKNNLFISPPFQWSYVSDVWRAFPSSHSNHWHGLCCYRIWTNPTCWQSGLLSLVTTFSHTQRDIHKHTIGML